MSSEPSPWVEAHPDHVRIDWGQGVAGAFAALWLADNRAEDRHANGQRLIDVLDLPESVRIQTATVVDGMLHVTFAGTVAPLVRPLAWLRATLGPLTAARPELDRAAWLDGARRVAARDFAWRTYAAVRADAALRGVWLRRLARDGIAFLSEVPCVEGMIVEVGSLLGAVAHTNYGVLFDVRAEPVPENLAYTDWGLGLHTDNPYRDPVPGFQALHVLVASPEGGDSLFADGLALAAHLRTIDAASFACLTRTPVPFHYRSAAADLCSEKPLIALDVAGDVRAVHYNNRSIAPLRLQGEAAQDFYCAYRAFARLLREPRFQLRLRLQAGELVVFDNRRILHGRTAFVSQHHPRHLQGCYLTRDSVLSNAALLP